MSRPSAAGSTEVVTALHAHELPRVPDVLHLVEALREQGFPWLLDSARQDPRLGRFSFVGGDPYLVLRSWGNESRLECRRRVRPDLAPGDTDRVADPFGLVRSLLPPKPVVGDLPVPFAGGAVGYFGYELAARVEKISLAARDDLGLPDLALLFVDRLVAIDHQEDRAWAIGLGFGESEIQAARNARVQCRAAVCLARSVPASVPGGPPRAAPASLTAAAPPGLEAFFDEDSYAEAVDETLRQIAAGNVYQANLTHRMDLAVPGADPLELYRALRELNPAPFAAYLELPELAILSSSPERFLKFEEGSRAVESRPIKGTRPRGAGRDEDDRLGEELRTSEKDRAENLMIVDLVRNDLGRVCDVGSVAVPELMSVEPYATVFQLVSTVTGRLREDRDAIDLVRAAFPPGSMTGAPKLAAMKLIDRLEPVRRGVYSGGLGYLDVRGGLDLSVVIRALLVERGRAHVHVGGGIVADSSPVAEYRETLDKARALLAALARVAPAADSGRATAAS